MSRLEALNELHKGGGELNLAIKSADRRIDKPGMLRVVIRERQKELRLKPHLQIEHPRRLWLG